MPSLAGVEKTSLGACPSIDGRYWDAGVAVDEQGAESGPVSLTSLLFSTRPAEELKDPGSTAAPLQTPDTIAVSGPDQDVIQFESFKGPASIALLRQARKGWLSHPFGYSCVSGFVILPSESGSAGAGAMAISSVALFFRKGEDGSLMVRSPRLSGALIAIVPLFRTETTWYRFSSVSEVQAAGPSEMPQDASDKDPPDQVGSPSD
jgi:hypothetical protein